MNGIGNIRPTNLLYNYKTEKVVDQQEFVAAENKKPDNDDRLLGIYGYSHESRLYGSRNI